MKLNVEDLIKAIWHIICLFIRSFVNKTDVIAEYHKDCEKMNQKMRDLLNNSDEGRAILTECMKHKAYNPVAA